jgi:hypothetical protein
MTKDKEPPPKDSLEKLADFTRRILQVPRSELPSRATSDGSKKTDEPSPET